MSDKNLTRIETYWDDTVIYMVQFNLFVNRYGLREIKKAILLEEEFSRPEVEEIKVTRKIVPTSSIKKKSENLRFTNIK